MATTCQECDSGKSVNLPEASIVQGPSRHCSLPQTEERSLLALGLPRGEAHEGVAPAKKKKKKWNRAKPSRDVMPCGHHQALGRRKIKDAIFFNYQKPSLLLVPADPQEPSSVSLPSWRSSTDGQDECDLKMNAHLLSP